MPAAGSDRERSVNRNPFGGLTPPKIVEFVVRWSFPRMTPANELNPEALRRAAGRPKLLTDREFVEAGPLPSGNGFYWPKTTEQPRTLNSQIRIVYEKNTKSPADRKDPRQSRPDGAFPGLPLF